MATVTDTASKILDSVDAEQTRLVSNTGPDAVEVSTDKHFAYGYGVRIPAGQSASAVVHLHEALWARCAPGKSATVTLDAPAVAPAAFEPVVFEVVGLDIPAGTDWSGEGAGHVLGTVALDPRCAVVVAVAIELDGPSPDYAVLQVAWFAAGTNSGPPHTSPLAGDLWAMAANVDTFANEALTSTAPLPTSIDVEARIYTAGAAISADTRIVRARAALLPI